MLGWDEYLALHVILITFRKNELLEKMNLRWKVDMVRRYGILSSVHSYCECYKREMKWCLEMRYEEELLQQINYMVDMISVFYA